jgi:hypothetical protein
MLNVQDNKFISINEEVRFENKNPIFRGLLGKLSNEGEARQMRLLFKIEFSGFYDRKNSRISKIYEIIPQNYSRQYK